MNVASGADKKVESGVSGAPHTEATQEGAKLDR